MTEDIKKPTVRSVEQFIINNFKNTSNEMDKLHIQNIRDIINDDGFDVGNKITTLFRKLQIGTYDKHITINKIRKAGFRKLIYMGSKTMSQTPKISYTP